MFQNHYCHCEIYNNDFVIVKYKTSFWVMKIIYSDKNYTIFVLLAVSQQNYCE